MSGALPNELQGYYFYFSRPLPMEQFTKLLREQRKLPLRGVDEGQHEQPAQTAAA